MKFYYVLQNQFGTFTSDPQECSEKLAAEALETIKQPLSYLSFPIKGTEVVFKGDCVKNCIIRIQKIEG